MNMRRLDIIINELEATREEKEKKEKDEEKEEKKDEVKNSKENWEEDSDKDLEKDSDKDLEKKNTETQSGDTFTISKMLQDAKNLIKNQIALAKTDQKDNNSFAQNKAIGLSKILSGQILLSSEIWGGEFLVNIDTNITEGGVSIGENEMLVAIISYGLLEILVEDNVQMELCAELEKSIEEKYGIAVQFLGVNNPDAQIFLKKGNKINVKS